MSGMCKGDVMGLQFAKGDRVRCIESHRQHGTVLAVQDQGILPVYSVALETPSGRPFECVYTEDELEFDTPCGCRWCSTRN